MFRTIKYSLEAADVQSIALPQTTIAANQPLILNGRQAVSPVLAQLNTNGFSYFVSLSSPNDLSKTSFNIQGYCNNKFINQTISGPNSNTIYSPVLFDSVVSITPTTIVASKVSAGILSNLSTVDQVIYSSPIMIDAPYRKNIDSVFSIESAATGTATYACYAAIEDIVNNGKAMNEMIGQELLYIVDEVTEGTFYQLTLPFKFVVFKVTIPKTEVFPATIIRFSQDV